MLVVFSWALGRALCSRRVIYRVLALVFFHRLIKKKQEPWTRRVIYRVVDLVFRALVMVSLADLEQCKSQQEKTS